MLLWIFLTLLANSAMASVLWSSTPVAADNVLEAAYPVGNGWLGGMPFGDPGAEAINLNIDSLWSGGPFQSLNYTGGNPIKPVFSALSGIRSFVFENGTGNVDALLNEIQDYGSYQVLGILNTVISSVILKSGYNRTLDLETGLHTTVFLATDGNNYSTTLYCSNPDSVCVYTIKSSYILPDVTISYTNAAFPLNSSLTNYTCGTGSLRFAGFTAAELGMKYDTIAGVSPSLATNCNNKTGALTILTSNNVTELAVVWTAGTDYDMTKGHAAMNYSFRGEDPSPKVEANLKSALSKPEPTIRKHHIDDLTKTLGTFTLNLLDTALSAGIETKTLLERYNDTVIEDPYLEKLIFDFGRYLFVSSSREGTLPPNLQGIWATDVSNPWSADYHANINLQMNMWGAVETGLGHLMSPLWNYMAKTWVPRGSETAQLLYGAEGWVVHDEVNIFGYTGMKDSAQWANYPAAAAWMMQHVWDYYDFVRDAAWWAAQGYPLVKGVAQFWLSQLVEDAFWNDGTLVVNPCNSPEHGPTTSACTHYQQLIHQVFEIVLTGASIAGETNITFLDNVRSSLTRLDKGLHIGDWGEVKEWKLPDSWGYDVQGDEHRHLSHLVGWFPGWSISSFENGYNNKSIQDAVTVALIDRGVGISDSDAGWEKMWRSACWARLNSSENAYFEYRLAIHHNFNYNALSMYTGISETSGAPETPFQIDANFGSVGAVVSMLVIDMPLSSENAGQDRIVVLGPAIPSAWGNGSVRGLKIRGGGTVDFDWDSHGVVTNATAFDTRNVRFINVRGRPLEGSKRRYEV